MKKGIGFLVLGVLMLAGVQAQVFADDAMSRCDRMRMAEKMWYKMDLADMFVFKAHFILANASDLGLSDDQMDKIMALKYGFKKSVIKNDADIESLVLDIKEELRKEEADVAAVNILIDKKYAAKAQRAKDIVSSYVSLKKVLTKEQMGKLKDLWQGGMMKKAKYPGIEKEGMEEPEKGG